MIGRAVVLGPKREKDQGTARPVHPGSRRKTTVGFFLVEEGNRRVCMLVKRMGRQQWERGVWSWLINSFEEVGSS